MDEQFTLFRAKLPGLVEALNLIAVTSVLKFAKLTTGNDTEEYFDVSSNFLGTLLRAGEHHDQRSRARPWFLYASDEHEQHRKVSYLNFTVSVICANSLI